MKKQSYYYTYQVTWSENDQEYLGTCLEFPSLAQLAKTHSFALRGIIKLVVGIVENMQANHEPTPYPIAKHFKGKFQSDVLPDEQRYYMP